MSRIHYVMSNSHRPPQDSGSTPVCPGGARGINPNCWRSLNSNASSCLLMLLPCTCILSRCRLGVYGVARSSDRYVARRHPSAELARILTDSRYLCKGPLQSSHLLEPYLHDGRASVVVLSNALFLPTSASLLPRSLYRRRRCDADTDETYPRWWALSLPTLGLLGEGGRSTPGTAQLCAPHA